MSLANWIGSIGVGLILIAFAGQQLRMIKGDGMPYLALNAVGGGLACLSSVMIDFLPFVILEGLWCLVAVAGLARRIVGKAPQAT